MRVVMNDAEEPAVPDAIGTHPEEIRTEFELHAGEHITLHGRLRITPAGLISAGLAVALVGFAIGFASRSARAQPRR